MPGLDVEVAGTNTLRLYDIYQNYTFNMAEFSIKRDPERGVPVRDGAGADGGAGRAEEPLDRDPAGRQRRVPVRQHAGGSTSRRRTSRGGFRSATARCSRSGKFVTLLGYEVIESPANLNYSRGYLFTLAIPLTTTGGLVSYSFTDWLSAQAGLVLGWDRSNTDNSGPSGTGQIAVTPMKDLSTALNFIVGPEISGDKNPIRWVVDLTANYTGLKDFTFGFNFDYGSAGQ